MIVITCGMRVFLGAKGCEGCLGRGYTQLFVVVSGWLAVTPFVFVRSSVQYVYQGGGSDGLFEHAGTLASPVCHSGVTVVLL
jgi:hypothetical protein